MAARVLSETEPAEALAALKECKYNSEAFGGRYALALMSASTHPEVTRTLIADIEANSSKAAKASPSAIAKVSWLRLALGEERQAREAAERAYRVLVRQFPPGERGDTGLDVAESSGQFDPRRAETIVRESEKDSFLLHRSLGRLALSLAPRHPDGALDIVRKIPAEGFPGNTSDRKKYLRYAVLASPPFALGVTDALASRAKDLDERLVDLMIVAAGALPTDRDTARQAIARVKALAPQLENEDPEQLHRRYGDLRLAPSLLAAAAVVDAQLGGDDPRELLLRALSFGHGKYESKWLFESDDHVALYATLLDEDVTRWLLRDISPLKTWSTEWKDIVQAWMATPLDKGLESMTSLAFAPPEKPGVQPDRRTLWFGVSILACPPERRVERLMLACQYWQDDWDSGWDHFKY